MEAKDLMIGDWLCYEGEHNKQVKGIDLPPNGNSAYISFENEFYPCDSFSPIPLTQEILEKIGFNREGGASYWHEGDLGACVLHWSKDKEQLIIGSPCDDCMVKMNVRYVHELQHAFRLAGIEKEIVL